MGLRGSNWCLLLRFSYLMFGVKLISRQFFCSSWCSCSRVCLVDTDVMNGVEIEHWFLVYYSIVASVFAVDIQTSIMAYS